MQKLFIGLLLLTGIQAKALTDKEPERKSVYLTGHIRTNTDSVNLLVGYWKNYITGSGKEQQVTYFPIGEDGRFKIKITAVDHPIRAQIIDILSNNVLFDNSQILEPGDSIFIDATIRDQQDFSEENFVAEFSGRGAGKYNCIQALKKISDEKIRHSVTPTAERIRIADSLVGVKEAILHRFKGQVSPEVYQMIRADIIGTTRYTVLLLESHKEGAKAGQGVESQILEDFISRPENISKDMLATSPAYIRFLYLKETLGHQVSIEDRSITLTDLYHRIKSSYRGLLREKLLAYLLLNSTNLAIASNQDCVAFTECLKDATGLLRTPWLKAPVEQVLRTRGKGAAAFDFALPADSSGRIVRLSDFKGKVVLVDMWGYICTGCYRFAGAFHERVYPVFKDNENFEVISIMLDQFAGKEQYLQRLRGEKGPPYTFPGYTNLYAGKGEPEGRRIEAHYNFQAYPFLLLVDKQGKIYSSTVPFIDEPDHPNVEPLIQLIKNALSSK